MSASTKPELLIQVVTSPHCPWCLVGHRRLHQVLDSDEFKADVAPCEWKRRFLTQRLCIKVLTLW